MSKSSRRVYRHAELERLLNPRSIAVVGVSQNPASMGNIAAARLAAFKGRSFLVNPKYDQIGSEKCYSSLAELPDAPDCVVITVPRAGVEATVVECAERGVGGVVVFASGYAETCMPERIALQQRLVSIGRDSGLRIMGPNCLGFMNIASRAIVSFTKGAIIPYEGVPPAAVGLISQSGSIAFSLAQAMFERASFSHVVACGNSCDVDIADGIAYLADDPSCKAIACILEGIAQPERLIEAADIAFAAGKPLVVYKLGVGEEGARATLSHTGTLAGTFAAYKAALERAGVVLTFDYGGLLRTASFLAKFPRPSSHGVAVVSGSGGMAITAADSAEVYGIGLSQPEEATRLRLKELIPDFGSTRNPVDATGMAGRSEGHVACFDAMLQSGMYGAGVFPQPTILEVTARRLELMGEVAKRHGKPICVVRYNGWTGWEGTKAVEASQNLALFDSMDQCFSTLACWHWRDDFIRLRETNGPRKVARLSQPEAKAKAAALIIGSLHTVLAEREAKEVLACYDVPVVEERLAQSRTQAVAAASSIGFPVVLKVESAGLPHKSEAGVVRLNIRSIEEVEVAYDMLMENACKLVPQSHIAGVLVQPMLSPGVEIMVGARIDPMFGPLVVAGIGGVFVELLKDSALEIAPIHADEAKAMLGKLKAKALLNGFRGMEPVDRDKLADIIVRIAEFASDQSDLIAEVDVNPLICGGGRIVAVDALIVRRNS